MRFPVHVEPKLVSRVSPFELGSRVLYLLLSGAGEKKQNKGRLEHFCFFSLSHVGNGLCWIVLHYDTI